MNARNGSVEELLAEAGFLRRLAHGLAADADADDLVQDTFVAALQHPPRGAGSLRGWLTTVAVNLSRNARRANRRREEREHSVARDERVETEEVGHDRIELQRSLLQLLLSLPAEQCTVVYLRYYEERTPTWIAEHLGVPIKTVKTRHTRAMASLRERLDARSGGDRRAWMEALAPSSALHGTHAAVSLTEAAIGGLVVKKLVLVGVAVLLVALAWLVLPHLRSDEHAAPTNSVPEVALDAPAKSPLAPLADAQTSVREVAVESTTSRTGGLEVRLSWSDGTPATDVGLEVRCTNDPAPRDEAFRAFTDTAGIARFPALFAGKVKLVPDMRERFEADVEAGTTSTVSHTFERGIDLRGHVVDPDGNPVATASVWCKGGDFGTADTVRASDCATDGSFQVRDVSEYAVIGARAPHFRPSTSAYVRDITVGPSGSREIEFRLGSSGGSVRGRVLDPDGKPAEHALVLAGERGGGTSTSTGPGRYTPQPGTAATDKEGRFELVEDLAPGAQPILACARGYPVWEGKVDVLAGATQSIEITLERSARIEGHVIGLDGRPASGMRVRVCKEERGGWYWDMFPASRCTSDEHGNFALDWVAAGAREIIADDSMRPEAGRGQTTVTCVAGETTMSDVKLERGNTIAGHVFDKDKAPLAGWNVYSESSDLVTRWYPRQTKTAMDGSFTILNLGPGEHDLLVRGPQYSGVPRAQVFRVPIGTEDVVLTVADAGAQRGSLRARFVDPTGHSVEDLQVTLWATDSTMGDYLEVDPQTGIVESQVQPGRYRFEALRGAVAILTSAEFSVVDGQLTDLGDLTLGSLGRAEIRITGLPPELKHMGLSLEGPGLHDSGILEWEDGVWRSKDLAAGAWVVTWMPPNIWLRGAEIEVPAGRTGHFELTAELAIPVEITFEDAGSGYITLEARDAAGKLLLLQHVGVGSEQHRIRQTIGLPRGRATISIQTLEQRKGSADVDVTPSLHAPVTVVLR